MDLKKSIRMAAAMNDTTQTEIAEKSGFSSAQMSLLLSRGSCTTSTLSKIAAALDMKVSELIKLGE